MTPAEAAKLTVPKLKAELSDRGLDTSGLKAVLLELLQAALVERIKPPPAISNVALQHEEWCTGQVQQVTWSSQGDVRSVDICLYKDILLYSTLQHDAENSGSSMVTLPAGLLPGQYHLQVRSSDNEDVTADSATFEVTCTGPPPAISNVAPQQPIWHSGSQQQVTWSCQGDVPTVRITLFKGNNSVINLPTCFLQHSA